jgi:hypothetical protein
VNGFVLQCTQARQNERQFWTTKSGVNYRDLSGVVRMPPSLFELRRARNTKAAPQQSDGGRNQEAAGQPRVSTPDRIQSNARPERATDVRSVE